MGPLPLIVSSMLALAGTAQPPPSAEVPVHVGIFKPADFPNLIQIERRMPQGEMVSRVEKILAHDDCKIAGQSQRSFNLTVPYAISLAQDGAVRKVVIGEIGCPSIERLVGQVVVAQAQRGDFKVSHQTGDQWYVSELNFSRGDTTANGHMPDQDRVICKAGEPILGTRTKTKRICRTVAEWRTFGSDREMMRRDLQNSSKGRAGEL